MASVSKVNTSEREPKEIRKIRYLRVRMEKDYDSACFVVELCSLSFRCIAINHSGLQTVPNLRQSTQNQNLFLKYSTASIFVRSLSIVNIRPPYGHLTSTLPFKRKKLYIQLKGLALQISCVALSSGLQSIYSNC